MRPNQQMQSLGVVQQGIPILSQPAEPFGLPAERAAAQTVIDELFAAVDRIGRVHSFAKGMGLAAPQIGIPRAAALVLPPTAGAEPIILLNPTITAVSDETDEKYEGCLSFFDVRGVVPRPLRMSVTATSLDGAITTVTYEFGLARLIAHEIDHLDGLLYTARMRPDVHPIPVEEYRGTGSAWAY
ncbi:peptide deformylase [Kitasatospora sp. CM 4170]|uniref:Peptide deformylase n=1 Tax=Kitasatospora aburaviensis TaxID=67265 RepID=A0ABW1F8M4_9ACTN|nr:peptide deformylase [Kitasatospora sp. CM 4170]WNM46633.1 peptide deformylase [Kitasatospora sp. CM 4170]